MSYFYFLINLQVPSAKCVINELIERSYSISASWNKYNRDFRWKSLYGNKNSWFNMRVYIFSYPPLWCLQVENQNYEVSFKECSDIYGRREKSDNVFWKNMHKCAFTTMLFKILLCIFEGHCLLLIIMSLMYFVCAWSGQIINIIKNHIWLK